MPEFENIEREYRQLSAKITYAIFEDGELCQTDLTRLEELAEMRVQLSAPDFTHLVGEAA